MSEQPVCVDDSAPAPILDFNQCRAERLYQEALRYEHDGNLDAAVAAFEQAVAMAPEYIDAQLALAAHYHRLGMLEEAIAHCKAVLQLQPEPAAYLYLGQALANCSEYDKAIAALRNCLTLDPTDAHAHHELAFVYYCQEQYDVAITEFHRAAQCEPRWETYFFLGECYRQTDYPDKAQAILRKALNHADTWGQIELTRAQMESVARRVEFSSEASLGIKERYYCESGIVYLGSNEDDGLTIPPYFFYDFGYTDIARTLRRLITVCDRLNVHFDAVVPADIVSLPLALTLAHHWQVGTEPASVGHTLVVQALAAESTSLQDALERTPGATTFCLCAAWDDPWLPDVVGVSPPLGGSIPWYQPKAHNGVASSVHLAGSTVAIQSGLSQIRPYEIPIEQIVAKIREALTTLPDEPTLEAHGEYYASQHSRLRFLS